MSIIEDYYNGVLVPIENFGHNKYSGYQDLSERVQERGKNSYKHSQKIKSTCITKSKMTGLICSIWN